MCEIIYSCLVILIISLYFFESGNMCVYIYILVLKSCLARLTSITVIIYIDPILVDIKLLNILEVLQYVFSCI